ncbi:MAG: outer membrane beta-barrel protein [Bacteroidales bacterium]|jgi:hypothetical protein|nr:outer membrane beta-barrel protein [Bacteroidales bacterium]
MKIKTTIVFIIMLCTMSSAYSEKAIDSTNYSVKGRWLLKASVSGYRAWFPYYWIPILGDFENGIIKPNLLNFRLEASYGINKYIEVGFSAGFQHYQYFISYGGVDLDSISDFSVLKKGFAPTFGVHFNFHLLPIFIKDKNCRWDLYLMAKYGFCYLPHLEDIALENFPQLFSHFRHEYGVGIGASVYFWNKIGLFTEFSLGQFSFHPYHTESPFNFRIGISYKFKKRTISQKSLLG